MKTILALTAALAATPAFAQDVSPTRALVNMVVAEMYCGMDAPESLVVAMGERSKAETGLDTSQTVIRAYGAAEAIGRDLALSGKLGGFCRNIGRVYGGLR